MASAHRVRNRFLISLALGLLISGLAWLWTLHNVGSHDPGLWERIPESFRNMLFICIVPGGYLFMHFHIQEPPRDVLGTTLAVVANGLIYAVALFVLGSIASLFRRKKPE